MEVDSVQAKIGVVERNIEVVEAEIGHVKAALNGGDAFLGLDGKSEEGTAELLKRLTALETKEGQLREKELLLLKSSQLAVAAPESSPGWRPRVESLQPPDGGRTGGSPSFLALAKEDSYCAEKGENYSDTPRAPSDEEVEEVPKPRPTPAGEAGHIKRRTSHKWPHAARIMLARTVLQVQPWTVAGNCFTVKSKWDTVFEILKTNEQVKPMFINKTESCIRSYYELLVKSKRASNAAALKEPGVSPPHLSDDEAQIDRIVGIIVDALAVEKAARAQKVAQNNSRRGAAESVSKARRKDTLNTPKSRGPFTQPPYNSVMTAREDDSVDWGRIAGLVGATEEDLFRFVDYGWSEGELSNEMAKNLFIGAIGQTARMFPGGPHGRYFDSTNAPLWHEMSFPGLPEEVARDMAVKCGFEWGEFKKGTSKKNMGLYLQGWKGDELPFDEADRITEKLARLCLAGRAREAELSNHDGNDVDANLDGEHAPEGQEEAQGKGKDRTPKRLHKKTEDALMSMIAETGRRAMSQKRKRQQDANFGAQEVIQHRSLARKEARDREVEAKRSRQERENERKDDANRRKDEIRILELQIELKDGGTGPGV